MNIYKITCFKPTDSLYQEVNIVIITASSSESAKLAYCIAYNISPEEIDSVDMLCPA